MLHFPDPFFIHVPLGFLMATIVGSTGWGVVGTLHMYCLLVCKRDIVSVHTYLGGDHVLCT